MSLSNKFNNLRLFCSNLSLLKSIIFFLSLIPQHFDLTLFISS